MPYAKPAPPYQATAFLEDADGRAGITENYWINVDVGDSYADALTSFHNLMQSRMALTTEELILRAIRVSDASLQGETLLRRYSEADGIGTFDVGGGGNLPLVNCLVLRFQGDSVPVHASRPLHGLPKILLDPLDDELFVPDVTWLALWDLFVADCVDRCQLVKQTPSRPGPGDPITFTTVGVADVQRNDDIRSHRIGRPFSLRRGKYAPR